MFNAYGPQDFNPMYNELYRTKMKNRAQKGSEFLFFRQKISRSQIAVSW